MKPRDLVEEGQRLENAGVLDEALDRYRAALERSDDPVLICGAFLRISHVHRATNDWRRALDAASASADAARRAGLTNALAEALNAEAAVHLSRGDFDAAVALLEEAHDIADDQRVLGVALQNLGSAAAQTGDLDTAERRFQASVACFRRGRYPRGEAFALNNQAAVALDRADFERAAALAKRSVDTARRVDDLDLLAVAMLNRAEALHALGQAAAAEEIASTALGFFTVIENTWRRARCLRLLGDFYRKRNACATARRFYDLGLRLARECDARLEITEFEERLAALDDEYSGPARDREKIEPKGRSAPPSTTADASREPPRGARHGRDA